ncbi:hypothetical protein [Hymenobacter rigui]|uniref:Uncharacterized protein n=1 Tax=Hymenobacter rigui TaxID=334424 RepID=A0A428KBX7_9BACT|nr:hypothetical protein [Hymenobacter rigui]RSK43915.1 hypothetical protein EI291_20785 [Hymenobacter rigui]
MLSPVVRYIYVSSCLLIICCGGPTDNKTAAEYGISVSPSSKNEAGLKSAAYSDQQLEAFLDSVGHLPSPPLTDRAALYADSIFYHQTSRSQTLTTQDFTLLKQAAWLGRMTRTEAQRIFRDATIGQGCSREGLFRKFAADSISVAFYPFRNNSFEEYAIGIGFLERCQPAPLFFFKKNKLIAIHDGYRHYGLDLKHYQDENNKTVVYYTREFRRGSGIWWNNLNFYRYDGDKLLPVLNELKDGNSQLFWGFRAWWLVFTIQSTNPLRIKMVYDVTLPDTTRVNSESFVVNDSTVVEYVWNDIQKKLVGRYKASKLSRAQILSYTVQENEMLFINAHYQELKSSLHDSVTRPAVLNYLQVIMNSH